MQTHIEDERAALLPEDEDEEALLVTIADKLSDSGLRVWWTNGAEYDLEDGGIEDTLVLAARSDCGGCTGCGPERDVGRLTVGEEVALGALLGVGLLWFVEEFLG